MNKDQFATIVKGDDARQALYRAAKSVGLPISDAAFDLFDSIQNYLLDDLSAWLGPGDTSDEMIGFLSDGMWQSSVSDWPTGSGVISVCSSNQAEQWAELGLWQCDLSDYERHPVNDTEDEWTGNASLFVGRDLSAIVDVLASALAHYVMSTLSDLDTEAS